MVELDVYNVQVNIIWKLMLRKMGVLAKLDI
jgi:hypothetical protein